MLLLLCQDIADSFAGDFSTEGQINDLKSGYFCN